MSITNGRLIFAIGLMASMAGCDSSSHEQSAPSVLDVEVKKVDSPYSVWVTQATISGNTLSERLAKDSSYGDQFCLADRAKPKGYKTTFALISTHEYNRLDLLERYQMDPEQVVTWGDTGVLLTDNLGSFVEQRGAVAIQSPVVREAALATVKITFSKHGVFTGYCDATKNYFYSVHSDPETGEMGIFSAHCDYPDTTLACMSIK